MIKRLIKNILYKNERVIMFRYNRGDHVRVRVPRPRQVRQGVPLSLAGTTPF